MKDTYRLVIVTVLLWIAVLIAFIGVAIVATSEAKALEEGATFDGGICWEADGTEEIAAPDGECVTPADYDAMFSFDNLASTPAIGGSGQVVHRGHNVAL